MTGNYSANPTPLPLPLQITSQPQDRTVSSDDSSAVIGQTTWLAGTGFARSRVIWERSIDNGQNWSLYGISDRQDGALYLTTLSPFFNGYMFRATAYPYEPFTTLANFRPQGLGPFDEAMETLYVDVAWANWSRVPPVNSTMVPLRIRGGAHGDPQNPDKILEFIPIKEETFYFTGVFTPRGVASFNAQILDKRSLMDYFTINRESTSPGLGISLGGNWVGPEITLELGDIFRFTFFSSDARSNYWFEFFKEVEFDKDLGVTSEPMTLTVI